MAEVLGAVASGISVAQLAGQVARSVLKLKHFCDQIKDAPGEIAFLLREIESVNLILSHIESGQSQQITAESSHNVCVNQSLQLCKEGAKELSGLVEELRMKIEGKSGWRKNINAAKVVLRKEEVKRLKGRMKNTIRLLSLSYQFHTNAMIQLQPEIIAARMSEAISTITSLKPEDSEKSRSIEDSTNNNGAEETTNIVKRQYQSWLSSPSWLRFLLGSIEYHQQTIKHKGKETEGISARYQFPSWVSYRVWDVKGYQKLSGWKLNLEIYRILPSGDPFFEALKKGDLATVRNRLIRKQNFITDRNHASLTALHIAAIYQHLGIFEFLITAGCDVLATDVSCSFTPLHFAVQPNASGPCSPTNFDNSHKITRHLINGGASEILVEDSIGVMSRFYGSPEMFRYLQQQMYPTFSEFPLNERFQLAEILASRGPHQIYAIEIIQMVVRGDNLDNKLITLNTIQAYDLVLSLVKGIARWAYLYPHSYLEGQKNIFEWRALLREVILASATFTTSGKLEEKLKIFGRSEWPMVPGHTVLSVFLGYYAYAADTHISEYNHQKPFNPMIRLLNDLLSDLYSTGVDLLKYGEQDEWPYLGHGVDFRTQYNLPSLRLITFTYGPRPEDWHFWFAEPTDSFAGEFWEMIERCDMESQAFEKVADAFVPGSWVEEYE